MYLLVEDRALHKDTPADMTARLQNFTYVYPYMRRIYLTDLQGKVLSSSDANDVGHSVFDFTPGLRANFASVVQRPVGSAELVSLTHERDADDSTFYLMITVRDADNHVGGVMIAELLDAPFEEMLRDISKRATRRATGLPDRARRRQAAGLACHRAMTRHCARCSKADPTLLERMSRDDAGWVLIRNTDQPMLVAFTRLPTYGANRAGGWRVVTIANYADVIAPLREMFFQIAGLVALRTGLQRHRGHRHRSPHGAPHRQSHRCRATNRRGRVIGACRGGRPATNPPSWRAPSTRWPIPFRARRSRSKPK